MTIGERENTNVALLGRITSRLWRLRERWIPIVSLAVVFVVGFSFYARLARRAYFHQDDFVFLARHQQSLYLEELFQFGRFVTQNGYWWVMSRLFGTSVGPYFAVNFVIITGTSAVIFLLLRKQVGAAAAFGGAAIYFSSPAVMWGYNWLSNSQHLIPHFLIFTFLLVYFGRSPDRTAWTPLSPATSAVLIAVLLVAALSNLFALLVGVIPVVDLICRRQRRPAFSELSLIAFWIVICVTAFTRSDFVGSEIYSTEIQFSRFLANGEIYFGSQTALFGWLLVCAYGGTSNLRSQRSLEATMYILSLVMYLPFGFLKYQIYPQYAAMTLVCLLVGLWISGIRILSLPGATIKQNPLFVGLSIFSVIWINGTPLSNSFANDILENPVGVEAYSYIQSLNELLSTEAPSKGEVLCFSSETEIFTLGESADWWYVGFGTAFELLVDERPTYVYADANDAETSCDRRFLFAPNLLLVEQ